VSVGAATLHAGAPVPFDGTEIDRELAAAHTLNGLASAANRVVFDVYDHCAVVVRFFVVEPSGEPRLVTFSGDRRLAPHRDALRSRAIQTGQQNVTTLGRPAGFRLVVAPLHDGGTVSGLLEFVVPADMVEPKTDRLALVVRAASSSLRAWRAATEAQHEASRAAGTSFALGLRLAGVLSRAGELGAAVRSAVELLARELRSPVIAWRVDPAGEVLRIAAWSGMHNARRHTVEEAVASVSLGHDRKHRLRELHDEVASALGTEVTLIDGGPVVFAAGGHHAELELCGHELGSLLGQLPVASVSTLDLCDGRGTVRARADRTLERTRLQDLTPRECEILAMLAGGARTAQIANQLVISEKTVKTHVQNILRKLDVSSRLEAAAIAVRAGFVPLSAS